MSSNIPVIGKLYERLVRQVKDLDERLMSEFEPSISKIEQLRYDFFKKCVGDSHAPATCYEQSERYEIRPDFEKAEKGLEECINIAAAKSDWEKAGDSCLVAYERTLKSGLESEINRVLKSL